MLTAHELSDLRDRAILVTQARQLRHPPGLPKMSARDAASALSGIVDLMAREQGMSAMRSACAMLARRTAARDWATLQGDSALRILAAVASGVALVAGIDNTISALAFWACETDPAVWREVAAAA